MTTSPPPAGGVAFDFRTLPPRDRYKLMIGSIVPRPIALVTTVDLQGRVNAAPYSFFNCLSHDPPILALGVETRADLSFKDTASNIRLTEVFCVNIVSRAIAEAMHVCAIAFPTGTDELVEAGLTAVPGTAIAAPRIAEAPAAFECRRHTTLELGRSRQIVLGEILHAHYHADLVDAERLRIDPEKLDAVARLGGATCCTIRDRFDMVAPSLEEWMAAKG
ncbi:flavin reductase family protein [Methylobacterium oryzihabitans]|uniref:Flavin reductase family protein n=1 Tax=Methylobacterium oryzihabitans TaxID=2499852 RepID=A0A3S2YL07_9HYPH|nr:flavin reductase family protein [Methylobacterium oryzihabitans]RVU13934.1 flavin reductase family protein [Methylobacterium oryzihabitans]